MSKLNYKNAAAILLVFYMGSYAIYAPSGLGSDGWIALLAGFLTAMPLFLLLARLVQIMPKMDLYEMLRYTLGRRTSIIVSLLYFCYFIGISATVQLYYGTFVQQTSLTNTPLIVTLLVLFILCIYLAKSGVETLGKWSIFLAAAVILTAVLLTLFAIPSMRVGNLLPLAANGGRAIARAGIRQAALPFGEAVVLLALLGRLDCKASPYKVFFLGAVLAAGFFVLTFLRDAAILGAGGMDAVRYPFFTAAGVIRIGGMETRIETLATIPFVIAGLTKAAIYLIAAIAVVRRFFVRKEGRRVLIWVAVLSFGLVVVLATYLRSPNVLQTVRLYAAPLFQLMIPLLIWFVAEIKRMGKLVVVEK